MSKSCADQETSFRTTRGNVGTTGFAGCFWDFNARVESMHWAKSTKLPQRTSQQYIGILIPLASIILKPAALAAQ